MAWSFGCCGARQDGVSRVAETMKEYGHHGHEPIGTRIGAGASGLTCRHADWLVRLGGGFHLLDFAAGLIVHS